MAHILLVEDDPDQRSIRKLILEGAGHTVVSAADPEEALVHLSVMPPEVIVSDLRLPDAAAGRDFLEEAHLLAPLARVVVLTGAPGEAQDLACADEVLRKPVRSEHLIKLIARLALLALLLALNVAGQWRFRSAAGEEIVAHLRLATPEADWAVEGREGAMATLSVDGQPRCQLMAPGVGRPIERSVFLGPLAAGEHALTVERHAGDSAAGARLAVEDVRFETLRPGTPEHLLLAHAPIIGARANTLGKFTDIPLLAYVTRNVDQGLTLLEYNVIFSNEDGGTSTRDLMARWGRTTDIEYVYRVWLDEANRIRRTEMQTKDHKDVEYTGPREGSHPLLAVITDNNMVSAETPGPVRYQLAPLLMDLAEHSREFVMDGAPWTYAVTAKELRREDKLRPPAKPSFERISDPRNYLVVEAKLKLDTGSVQVLVRLDGARQWTGGALGLDNNYLKRSGWVRTAIELPPGTRAEQIKELGVQCAVDRDWTKKTGPKYGHCTIESFGSVFLLNADYTPGSSLKLPAGPWELNAGDLRGIPLL